jgi:hypothetical protein
LLTGELIENKKSPTVAAICNFSEARTAEITPKKDTEEVTDITGESIGSGTDTDDNQISIDDFETMQAEESQGEEPPTDTANEQASEESL